MCLDIICKESEFVLNELFDAEWRTMTSRAEWVCSLLLFPPSHAQEWEISVISILLSFVITTVYTRTKPPGPYASVSSLSPEYLNFGWDASSYDSFFFVWAIIIGSILFRKGPLIAIAHEAPKKTHFGQRKRGELSAPCENFAHTREMIPISSVLVFSAHAPKMSSRGQASNKEMLRSSCLPLFQKWLSSQEAPFRSKSLSLKYACTFNFQVWIAILPSSSGSDYSFHSSIEQGQIMMLQGIKGPKLKTAFFSSPHYCPENAPRLQGSMRNEWFDVNVK